MVPEFSTGETLVTTINLFFQPKLYIVKQ